jgi:hypothetical protein
MSFSVNGLILWLSILCVTCSLAVTILKDLVGTTLSSDGFRAES